MYDCLAALVQNFFAHAPLRDISLVSLAMIQNAALSCFGTRSINFTSPKTLSFRFSHLASRNIFPQQNHLPKADILRYAPFQ